MDHPLASDSLLVDGCIHTEVPDVKPRGTYIVVRACMRPLPRSIPRVYDYEAPLTYSTLHICVNTQTPKKDCLSLFEVTICHISDVSAIANISDKPYHSYTE